MSESRSDLAEYRRKREFARTAEPEGARGGGAGDGGQPVFVVQLHDARRMHFDFRLEADGVLKSWAVPKGPSNDPRVKRLATPVEDHPMDYRGFEGVIAKGEYGGGTVMVWDEGTFRNRTRSGRSEISLAEGLEKGHVSFVLEGHKLHGAFALTRMGGRGGSDDWLLVKKSDRYAKPDQEADPRRLRSARTGRTLSRIAADAADGKGEGTGTTPGRSARARAAQLIERSGPTYAQEAGIRLKDAPSPLYQLLVLTTLLSAPIGTPIALAAAREIYAAGWRTPAAMASASWQSIVDALGRAHYRRYDESTATALGEGAGLLLDRWHGDLRRLRDEAGGDPERIRASLRAFRRIGPVGAEIFCREAQGVWPALRPSFDRRALDGAAKLRLPRNPAKLASLVDGEELPRLAAALVRATL
jgi:DNA ligase D-like protein (predicted 3'-phosphoesterase)